MKNSLFGVLWGLWLVLMVVTVAESRPFRVQQLDADLLNYTTATLPAAGIPGRLAWVTDGATPGLFTDTGTAWTLVAVSGSTCVDPQIINVKCEPYNAIGDGVDDDTDAVLGAFTDAVGTPGSILYFPPGIYDITGWTVQTTVVPMVVVGAGKGISILKGVSTASFLSVTGNITIKNLTLDTWSNALDFSAIPVSTTLDKVRVEYVEIKNGVRGVWSTTTTCTVGTTCSGLSKAVFHDLTITNMTGEAFNLGNAFLGDITVTGSHITTAIRRGIGLGSNAPEYMDIRGPYTVNGNTIDGITSPVSSSSALGIVMYGRTCNAADNHLFRVYRTISSTDLSVDLDATDANGLYTKCRFSNLIGNSLVDAGQSEGAIDVKGLGNAVTGTSPNGYAVTVIGNVALDTGTLGGQTKCIKLATDDVLVQGNICEGFTDVALYSQSSTSPENADTWSTATSGGTLAADTYCYRVTFLIGLGESVPSDELCQITTGATSTITLAWNVVANVTGYNVYCRTTGAELLCATYTASPSGWSVGAGGVVTCTIGGSSDTSCFSWTDTGAATPAGALPLTNSTGVYGNHLVQGNQFKKLRGNYAMAFFGAGNNVRAINNTTDGLEGSYGAGVPVNGTFTTATTGGTLANSTAYYYRVSSLNVDGQETTASTETSITTGASGGAHTVTPTWSTPYGSAGVKVYCRTTGAELLCATWDGTTWSVGSGTSTSWTDTGAVTPSGALPTVNDAANQNVCIKVAKTGGKGTDVINNRCMNVTNNGASPVGVQVKNTALVTGMRIMDNDSDGVKYGVQYSGTAPDDVIQRHNSVHNLVAGGADYLYSVTPTNLIDIAMVPITVGVLESSTPDIWGVYNADPAEASSVYVYGTRTSATNFERFGLRTTLSTNSIVSMRGSAGGSANSIELCIEIDPTVNCYLTLSTGGNFNPVTDDVTNLGAGPSNRFESLILSKDLGSATYPTRSAYLSTSLILGAGTPVKKFLSDTATLDFPLSAGPGCDVLTIPVTGAVTGSSGSVALGIPINAVDTETVSSYFGWVSAADTVTVRHCALTATDPTSGTFRATITYF